jgi:hypothetical protein
MSQTNQENTTDSWAKGSDSIDPCQNCEHQKLCGTQHKACERFAMYVINGRIYKELPKNPTFMMYYRTMELNDYTEVAREIFKRLRKELPC